jgi:hypothetical protein
LNKKFERFGVIFSDATITNCLLPPSLAEKLQKETTFDSMQKEEEKSHEYQLKVLNDNAALQMKKLMASSERNIADEEAKKERALITKGQKEIEAQRKKQLAIIKAEEEAEVLKYKAESEVINAKIKGEKEASLMILKAEGEASAQKIKVDQQALVEVVKAQAELEAAENIAKALLIEAEAEEKASIQLKEKRSHDLAMSRLVALEKLTKNGKIIISGEQGDSLIKSVVDMSK